MILRILRAIDSLTLAPRPRKPPADMVYRIKIEVDSDDAIAAIERVAASLREAAAAAEKAHESLPKEG
ncbi:MAG: hypothetical protein IT374_26190 [Polyangiaceae bacterium]|nr:hypothetical protein [Polyangiaceae bacterium]